MFQSSSTASGMPTRQTSSACSPSSASLISNSSPSRIRRATLRMTLESSTIRQVFIAPSLRCRAGGPAPLFHAAIQIPCRASCRLGPGTDLEHTVDIENDEQAPIEPIHARRDTSEPAVEIDRVVLAASRMKLEHLADRIDQQAIGLTPAFDSDGNAGAAIREHRQAKPSA